MHTKSSNGIARPGGGATAGTDQGVQLVDEQDDVPARPEPDRGRA